MRTRSLRPFAVQQNIRVRQYSEKVDFSVVLTRDLFLSSGKLNSSNKVNYDGMKPGFYQRSATDFESQVVERRGIGNNRILERLQLDKHFPQTIASRLQPIERFVGEEYPLSTIEKISIICGLSNFSLEIPSPNNKHKVYVETDKLRQYGKSTLDLHLNLETVFTNEKFLSSSIYELNHDIELFENSSMILRFMKNNLMYNATIPFKGSMKLGKITNQEVDKVTKEKILNATSIGSFYTLIGLLCTKFNKQEVIDNVVLGKILHGPNGLINIATSEFTNGTI